MIFISDKGTEEVRLYCAALLCSHNQTLEEFRCITGECFSCRGTLGSDAGGH